MSSPQPPITPTPKLPSPSLKDLPTEVLASIASYLDGQSAHAYFLVGKTFQLPADDGIWPSLNLTIPSDRRDEPGYMQANEERKEAERVHLTKSAEKVRKILEIGRGRRLGMVRSLYIGNVPETADDTLEILEVVAPNLTYLELIGHDPLIPIENPDFISRLDTTFPSLTTICINSMSLRSGASVSAICSRAPNLTTLHVNIDHRLSWFTHSRPTLNNHLRRLHISFRDRPLNPHISHSIPELLSLSPNLRQVSLRYGGMHVYRMIKELGSLPHLEDLSWSLEPTAFGEVVEESMEPLFASLRRLALKSADEMTLGRWLPQLPALEAFHLEVSYRNPPPKPLPIFPLNPSITLSPWMTRSFADGIRASHNLRQIHILRYEPLQNGVEVFDQLDGIGKAAGNNVRSYRYGYRELVALDYRSEVEWQQWADCDGRSVPFQLVEKMRIAQGASVQEWDGRGIELGAAAGELLDEYLRKTPKTKSAVRD